MHTCKLPLILCTIAIVHSPSSYSDNIFSSISNSITGSKCGLPAETVSSLMSKPRGPIDGGSDENDDGKVDYIEAYTTWDFAQTMYVLHTGVEHKKYTWTNVDTCFKFEVIAKDFKEDKSQPILWQTCREFEYQVINPDGDHIGGEKNGYACRNFGTKDWFIL